jgi:hypothetical protein
MKKVQVPWEIQHRRLSAATTTTLSSKIWMSDTATSLYSTRTREGVAAVWVAARWRWLRERNWEGRGQRLQSRTVRAPALMRTVGEGCGNGEWLLAEDGSFRKKIDLLPEMGRSWASTLHTRPRGPENKGRVQREVSCRRTGATPIHRPLQRSVRRRVPLSAYHRSNRLAQ